MQRRQRVRDVQRRYGQTRDEGGSGRAGQSEVGRGHGAARSVRRVHRRGRQHDAEGFQLRRRCRYGCQQLQAYDESGRQGRDPLQDQQLGGEPEGAQRERTALRVREDRCGQQGERPHRAEPLCERLRFARRS